MSYRGRIGESRASGSIGDLCSYIVLGLVRRTTMKIWEGHGLGEIQFRCTEILRRAEVVGGGRRRLIWIHDTFSEEQQRSRPELLTLAKPESQSGGWESDLLGDFQRLCISILGCVLRMSPGV